MKTKTLPNPKTMIALQLAKRGKGCDCALCGDSPFDSGGPVKKAVSANFVDYHILGTATEICKGCLEIMGGRPGREPPPIRSRNLFVIEGKLEQVDDARLLELACDPPENCVLSWATSKKRHHWISAGISGPSGVIMGSDYGPIEINPENASIQAHAVSFMLSAKGKRSEIHGGMYSGIYSTVSIAGLELGQFIAAESIISEMRGTRLLDFFLAVCKPLKGAWKGSSHMISDIDRRASDMLAYIALSSDLRSSNGLDFWKFHFVRAVTRFSRLPLVDLVQRLLKTLRCTPCTPGVTELMTDLKDMPREDMLAISQSIRERPNVVVSLAFENHKRMKEVK